MRGALSLVLMLGFMLPAVGCGGGEKEAEAEAEQVSHVLRIEARGSGSDYTFHLGGADEATDFDGVKQALKEHAASTEGGLEGRDAEGISRNPVRFSADVDVSSRAFLQVLEHLALASMPRIEGELVMPDGETRRFHYELPVDEGLSPPNIVPERDSGASAPTSPSPVQLYVMPVENDGVAFVLAYNSRMRRPVPDMENADNLVSGFTLDGYNAVRETLADGVPGYVRKLEHPVSHLEINLRTADDFAPWVGAFAAYEALSGITREDGERWQVSWAYTRAND